MDFYLSSATQPYALIGMPSNPFSQTNDESRVSVSDDQLESNFLTYDVFGRSFDPGVVLPATAGSPPAPPTPSIMASGSVDSGIVQDIESDRTRTRGSSEEKEALTPAQSRRKAQNRAAQRAFRERKERHVKDLEAKLTTLESATQNLQTDNERLKLALQRATAEVEILRATSGTSGGSGGHVSLSNPPSPTSPSGSTLGDGAVAAVKDPYTTGLATSVGHLSLLPAGATWDLIQSHPLYKAGLVDIGDVCERLKKLTRCDGRGPVFEESEVWRAIEESRRGGGDELI